MPVSEILLFQNFDAGIFPISSHFLHFPQAISAKKDAGGGPKI